ncbi:CdaR family protein [Eremococcus coleocola]|uniref:CdaR family protein n=1 Tax=Eremococcus coleocola TaxID=88132 RepID=UPI0003FD0D71|nr:CdaR family protein [Eremococcus coleocola]
MKTNKLFDNKWFLRLVSLLFAIFLHVAVSQSNTQFTQANRQSNTSVNVTETISNVPVYVGDIDDDMFVSGLPETVSVELTGPRNIINQATAGDTHAVTEDLTGVNTGKRTVKLIMEGLPEGIDYRITPSRVMVEIGKLEQKTVKVEYELAKNLIADGYQVDSVAVNPQEVTLTGRSDEIAKVSRAFIRIGANNPVTESFSETYVLQVADADGNLLDVNVDQTDIKADVTISADGKSVPINIVPEGEQTENYTYQYAYADVANVVINGDQSVLDQIASVDAVVDVSDMTQSGIRTAYLQMPEGLDQMSYQHISVTVTLSAINQSSQISSEAVSESNASQESEENQVTSTEDESE